MTARKAIYLKDLTVAFVVKELKSKYKSATLGFLWILINPLLQMIVLTIVFSIFLKVPVKNYPLFVFSGLLPWMFFSLSLQNGTSSLIANRDLIKKVNFPRELLPISSVLAHLSTFILAMVLLALFVAIVFGVTFSFFLLIPIVVLMTLLAIGITLLLSSFDIYYRDVSFILQSALLVWFYITPILYPTALVPESFLFLYNLNPMVGIITAFQAIFLNTNMPAWNVLTISVFETSILLLVGFFVFAKRSKYFADWV
ncbi:MAG: ABC transporter permease [Patescibacteria group bacterium]